MILLSRPHRFLVAGLVGINILLFSLSWYSLHQSRRQYELRAETFGQNITSALDQDFSSSIDKIDLALRTVVKMLENQSRNKWLDDSAINDFLTEYSRMMPEVEGLRVSNSNGDIILGNRVNKEDKFTASGRDYFIYHHDTPNDSLHISKPILGRVVNHYIFVFSRRYNYPDGRFKGVVFATIALSHFEQLLSRFNIGSNGLITIRDSDLGLIIRHPSITGPAGEIGNSIVSGDLRKLFESGVHTATYHATVPADGLDRIMIFHRMETTPIMLFGLFGKTG